MESFPARQHIVSTSSDNSRQYDEVRFVDLTFLLNWTEFFSKSLDKQVQLGVKGPHTNHCFIFEAREVQGEDLSIIRQVVTSCKRFMSPSGKEVPMILPDLSSSHWKDFKKLGNKQIIDYDPESCSSEINDLIQQSVETTDKNTLLGLRIFKISNDLNYIFNICEQPLNDCDITIAPFEEKVKAHMVFDYCHHIRNNTGRFSIEEKDQVLEFMQLKFPSKLVNNKTGFPKNAAVEFVEQKYGPDYVNILQRVKEKSKIVKRLPKEMYINSNHSLRTDEEALAKLPKVAFLLGVSNSRNAEEGNFNRIANSILGSNLTKIAIPMLQQVLQKNQTPLTEEEMQIKAARKVAAVLKGKATRARNKEKVITDRILDALPNQSSNPGNHTTQITPKPIVEGSTNGTTRIVSRSTVSISAVTEPFQITEPFPRKRVHKSKNMIPTSTTTSASNLTTSTDDVNINKVSKKNIQPIDIETFLINIDPTIYSWQYIKLDDTRSFDGLLTKVQPHERNKNITTIGIIMNEDIVVNRRPRDPRCFNVQMMGYDTTHIFPAKYLWITDCRYSI